MGDYSGKLRHILYSGLLAAGIANTPAIAHGIKNDSTATPVSTTEKSKENPNSNSTADSSIEGRLGVLDGIYQKINEKFNLKGPFEREPYSPLWNYSARTQIDEETGDREIILEQYSNLRANELSGLWQIADIDITAAFLDAADQKKLSERGIVRNSLVGTLTSAYAKLNGLYDFENRKIKDEMARNLLTGQVITTQFGGKTEDEKSGKYKNAGLTDAEMYLVEYVHWANGVLDFAHQFWKDYPELKNNIIQNQDEIAGLREQIGAGKGDKSKLEQRLHDAKSLADSLNKSLLARGEEYGVLTQNYETRIGQLTQENTSLTEGSQALQGKLDESIRRSEAQKTKYESRLSNAGKEKDRVQGLYDKTQQALEDANTKLSKTNTEMGRLTDLYNTTNEALDAANATLTQLRTDIEGLESRLGITDAKGAVEVGVAGVYSPDDGKFIGVLGSARKPLIVAKQADGTYRAVLTAGFDVGRTNNSLDEVVVPYSRQNIGAGFEAETEATRHAEESHTDIAFGVDWYLLPSLGITGSAGVDLSQKSGSTTGIENLYFNGNQIGDNGVKQTDATSENKAKPYGSIGIVVKPSRRTSAKLGVNSRKEVQGQVGLTF